MFFFDRTIGAQPPRRDEVGTDFADLAAARAHGMTLLPVLGLELPLKVGETRSWTVTIRNSLGTIVARFIMAVINDHCGPEPERVLRVV